MDLVKPCPVHMSPAKKQKHLANVTWEAVNCDKCWKDVATYTCQQCNWDVCTECAGLQKSPVSRSQL